MNKKDSVLKYMSCDCVHEDCDGKLYCDGGYKSVVCVLCLIAQQYYNKSLNFDEETKVITNEEN